MAIIRNGVIYRNHDYVSSMSSETLDDKSLAAVSAVLTDLKIDHCVFFNGHCQFCSDGFETAVITVLQKEREKLESQSDGE